MVHTIFRIGLLLAVLSLLLFLAQVKCDDVAASTAQLRLLAREELGLLDTLDKFIGEERGKFEQLQESHRTISKGRSPTNMKPEIPDSNLDADDHYLLPHEELAMLDALDKHIADGRRRLDSLQESHGIISNLLSKYDMRPDHPVSAYHLVRRFTTFWKNILEFLPYTSADQKQLNQTLTNLTINGVARSLVRLQMTYNLDIPNLLNGDIKGRKSQPLSQLDSVVIGNQAVSDQEYEMATEWLTHTQQHQESPLVSPEDLSRVLGLAKHKGDSSKLESIAVKPMEMNPHGKPTSTVSDKTKTAKQAPHYQDDPDYLRLCRASVADSFVKKNLKCQLKRDKVIRYKFYKVEFAHKSPDILLFHDVVTDDEATEMKRIAMDQLERATVFVISDSGEYEDFEVTHRYGKIGWLHDSPDNQIISKISRRVGAMLGVKTVYPSAEPLQMSNYGTGGHYSPHYDFFYQHFDGTQWSSDLPDDRLATFMFYLNDVDLGGSTVFPKLNLGVRPVKNSAVFWYNFDTSIYPEVKSFHAGCPVLIGEKWVANKWIRWYQNEFTRPCAAKHAKR